MRCQPFTNFTGYQGIIFGASATRHIGTNWLPMGKGFGQFDIGADSGKHSSLSELTGHSIRDAAVLSNTAIKHDRQKGQQFQVRIRS